MKPIMRQLQYIVWLVIKYIVVMMAVMLFLPLLLVLYKSRSDEITIENPWKKE